MNLKIRIYTLILLGFSLPLILVGQMVSAQSPKKVLILPFQIHAENDLSFLQKGIADMLSTRLANIAQLTPIVKEDTRRAVEDIEDPINPLTALTISEGLQADYVVYGSLTIFGSSISTDARFIDVHQKEPLVIFNQIGKSHDEVIGHINLFAGRIHETLTGQKTVTRQQTRSQPTVSDTHKHPETLLSEETLETPREGYVSPLIAPTAFDIWKSRRYKLKINGMAVGDVDGDGHNEIVFVGGHTIYINRYADNQFRGITKIEEKPFNKFIGVDVADINGNGKAEIFITNLPRTFGKLKSFVLEWNGAQFEKIAKEQNWYYRVLAMPERGKMLLGQRRGRVTEDVSEYMEKGIFKGGVYELAWENGMYEPVQRQKIPDWLNVYGFTYGDALNTGREMIVAFTRSEKISIVDGTGDEEWISIERFGGNPTFLEYTSEKQKTNREEHRKIDRYFLPQRIYVADLDKDGKNEVIAVKNFNSVGQTFTNVRKFKSGQIECLVWGRLGMNLKWATRKISGYISDYTIADLNNDGREELVFSVVAKKSGFMTDYKSYIVSLYPEE